MSEPLHDYDPAEVLDSAEAIDVFMADALEINDEAYVAKAEAVVEKWRPCAGAGIFPAAVRARH